MPGLADQLRELIGVAVRVGDPLGRVKRRQEGRRPKSPSARSRSRSVWGSKTDARRQSATRRVEQSPRRRRAWCPSRVPPPRSSPPASSARSRMPRAARSPSEQRQLDDLKHALAQVPSAQPTTGRNDVAARIARLALRSGRVCAQRPGRLGHRPAPDRPRPARRHVARRPAVDLAQSAAATDAAATTTSSTTPPTPTGVVITGLHVVARTASRASCSASASSRRSPT